MFEKNDGTLFTARVILNVVVWIFVLAGVISGIILLVNESTALGLVMLLLVPFLSWLMWVVARLFLTYLCDIKLIRNKLYGIDNDYLQAFLGGETQEEREEKKADTFAAVYNLYQKGVLTEEEYTAQKNILLKDDIEHYDERVKEAQQEEAETRGAVANEINDLFRLKKLLDKGAITQEEFDREKKKFIN